MLCSCPLQTCFDHHYLITRVFIFFGSFAGRLRSRSALTEWDTKICLLHAGVCAECLFSERKLVAYARKAWLDVGARACGEKPRAELI